jgi:hypothetical protein
MNRIFVAVFAVMSVSSAAFAQSAINPPPISHAEIERAAAASMSLYPADHYVRNANNCGPEMARAVWGPNGTLLGYACYSNPNGG